jgi:N-acetylglutamate synthase-like GNAT family acetyltransferase
MIRQIEYRDLVSYLNLEEPAGAHIVALHQGRLVGSLSLQLHQPGGVIHAFTVDQAYTQEDVATHLVQKAADICQAHGKLVLSASVPLQSKQSMQLYQGLGFRPFEVDAKGLRYITLLPLPEHQELTYREYGQR